MIGSARHVYLTLDWTDPKTRGGSAFQILSVDGRAIPIAWITIARTDLKDRMREYEQALCSQVTRLLSAGCRRI